MNFLAELVRYGLKIWTRIYYFLASFEKQNLGYIPSAGKVINSVELCNMVDASLDMGLTIGRFNSLFEEKFANYLGLNHVLTVNSGSSANLLALSALMSGKLGKRKINVGDEVLTVAANFPTVVSPIVQLGLIPVFIDCEIDTYNIDVSRIEAALSSKTKAVFIAHTLGSPFDVEKVLEICKKHNLWLIEDCCDALGATYDGYLAGTVGHIGTFSFYPANHITMGEGGAVVTNDTQLYSIMHSIRDWGRDCHCAPGEDNACRKRFSAQYGKLPFGYDHKFTYSNFGYNLKITEWQAAIGVAQLQKLPDFLYKRAENANYLMQKLSDLKDYFVLPTVMEKSQPSWFGFLISVKPSCNFTKQQLVEYLESNGVGTRQLFAGNILRHPMFVDNQIKIRINNSKILFSNELEEKDFLFLPNSEFVMHNTFWVGVYPGLHDEDFDRISKLIHHFVVENLH